MRSPSAVSVTRWMTTGMVQSPGRTQETNQENNNSRLKRDPEKREPNPTWTNNGAWS